MSDPTPETLNSLFKGDDVMHGPRGVYLRPVGSTETNPFDAPEDGDKALYRNDVVVHHIAHMLARAILEYGPDKVSASIRLARALAQTKHEEEKP